jgi:hypothetical protein
MNSYTSIRMAIALVCLAAATEPALGHHSFPATYMVDQTVTIEGTVVQFMFRNPHSFVHVMTVDKKTGEKTTWAAEWGASGTLSTDKVMPNSLKPGDKVIIIGNPARDSAAHRLRMRSIERPSDGWKWAGTFG